MTVLDYFNKRIPIFCARKIDINNNINIRQYKNNKDTEYRIIPNNKFIQTIKDAAKLLTIDSMQHKYVQDNCDDVIVVITCFLYIILFRVTFHTMNSNVKTKKSRKS